MSQQMTAVNEINAIQNALTKALPQIRSVIANGISPEKMARVVVNELSGKPTLRKAAAANPMSLIRSVIQSSQLGLEIGGHLAQSHLVPFKDEVTLIVGYRGLIALARRSGQITNICAELVYEKDEFDLNLGVDPHVVHKPFLKGNRGEPYLAYMVAKFKDGGSHFEWMTIEQINKIRDGSPAYQYAKRYSKPSPWDDHYEEQCRKTVIRRGWKYLPMSVEMVNAMAVETASDLGKRTENIDGSVVILDNEPNEKPETYPQDQFDHELATLREIIESGKKPVNEVIATLESVAPLTDDQKMTLASFAPSTINTNQSGGLL